MTNEQKLQHYQEMLELVKKYLDINYEYLTLFGFEVELEKIVEKIDDLSYQVNVLKDQQDQIDELEDQVSDLKNEISLQFPDFLHVNGFNWNLIKETLEEQSEETQKEINKLLTII